MPGLTTYRNVLLSLLAVIAIAVQAQDNQLAIARVELMPNNPAPYVMRDWKTVAQQYDAFVYDLDKTGEYLPLVFTFPSGISYPENQAFGLSSYVGSPGQNGEAINVLPSLVGGTLVGIDKSDQNGYNWILMSQDFFGRNNGEGIYVNNRGGSSGNDWWYDMMPNIYFYQLYDLYGTVGEYQTQFASVADQFATAVRHMGGSDTPWQRASMNYRAWSFADMEPNTDGVVEPEAAGAYAWVLYHAYKETGHPEYLKAAEWSMEFLNSLGSNPSYELQLPYGAYAAAKMNAELNTGYNMEKLMFWVFNRGPIRGWGTIVGNWGGVDVSGLVGEANDQGNDYAFQMNGVQQAAALVPLVRYDKRFARTLAKWLLNVANATRLMFPGFLPAAQQDASGWSAEYDPDAVIGYEAMREQANGYSPYATGDAVGGGWAATNLALYGTSSVGYLGAMISPTDQEQILLVDVLKTDFFRDTAYPTFLLFNPHPGVRMVTVDVGAEPVDVYDALSGTFLHSGVSGEIAVEIPGDEAVMLVYTPAGGVITYQENKMLVDGVIVDYGQSAVAYNATPRIQALAAISEAVETGDTISVYGAAIDPETKDLTYQWAADCGTILGEGEEVEWIAPALTGECLITLIVHDDDGNSDTAELTLVVVDEINLSPVIERLDVPRTYIASQTALEVSCTAADPNGDPVEYIWSATGGEISGIGPVVTWTSPAEHGIFTIRVRVEDDQGAAASAEARVLTYDFGSGDGDLVAHYPFDGDADDISGNALHGDVSGAKLTNDRLGNPESAYFFDGVNDHITVTNAPVLNFTNGITVSCWVKPLLLPDRETFIISHGSWQNRWKVSVTPDRVVRWTVKNATGQVRDIDALSELVPDSVYHVAASYNGDYMLLYIDGRLEGFAAFSGEINQTGIDLEIAQMLPDVQEFNMRADLDDIRIYNYGIHPDTVKALAGVQVSGTHAIDISDKLAVYPNPVRDVLHVEVLFDFQDATLSVMDQWGRVVWASGADPVNATRIPVAGLPVGIYFLLLESRDGVGVSKFMKYN